MPFSMIEDESAGPIAVSPLGSQTKMLSPDDVPELVEEFGLVALDRGRYLLGHAPQSGNLFPAMQP
jgi:hypothetical protein